MNFIELRDSGKILLVACGQGHEPFEVAANRLIQLDDGTILVPPTACPMCNLAKLSLLKLVSIEPDFKLEPPEGFVKL